MSTRPGTTVAPSTSTIRASGPARSRSSSAVPVASILPPRISTAPHGSSPGAIGRTVPPWSRTGRPGSSAIATGVYAWTMRLVKRQRPSTFASVSS